VEAFARGFPMPGLWLRWPCWERELAVAVGSCVQFWAGVGCGFRAWPCHLSTGLHFTLPRHVGGRWMAGGGRHTSGTSGRGDDAWTVPL